MSHSFNQTAELVLEIFGEEIPARMQLNAADQFKTSLQDYFKSKGVEAVETHTYITPRRLVAVMILPLQTTARSEERRGPRVGAPVQAIDGFLKSSGLNKNDLVEKDGYYYANLNFAAQSTVSFVAQAIEHVLKNFSWEKSMRWPQYHHHTWVRPIRAISCTFDGQPVMAHVYNMKITHEIVGHRFLNPAPFQLKSFDDYKKNLRDHFVILDHHERQKMIRDQLQELAIKHDLVVNEDENLIREVAGLVEWPCCGLGIVEDEFMILPEAVLITSMRVHQKYFTFRKKDGNLAPYFAFTANRPITQIMRQGYERVLKARLNDGLFFYKTDSANRLETFIPKLDNIMFHAKLGTLGQKITRLESLMSTSDGKRAAQLCKADLVSKMVYEFPELQGIMGQVYANLQGEKPEIACAICEHYQPQGPNDNCPSALLSYQLALADKIDTLAGFFGINELPTGSKDPYALRRCALGVIRIIIENDLRDLDLKPVIIQALQNYKDQGINVGDVTEITALIFNFISERLKVFLQAQSIRHDYVNAVLAEKSHFNIWAINARGHALNDYLSKAQGQLFLDAYRRASGIMAQNKQMIKEVALTLDDCSEPQEKDLLSALNQIKQESLNASENQNFQKLMNLLGLLEQPIQKFFELTINHEDAKIRDLRVNLLNLFVKELLPIADFQKIEK